ncbi:toll/interleukin-1 receptor domain-containing protein [Streptomyces phaeochromogenes]|uniref:toll/interleukin-1 receptor domain-containing protein n=1 Tax=Streptomyces phaeochromogenes TaxID=1923 RepID=UPI0012FEB4AE|nr:toll/interleukin-1 receptor domain-containing protein [Streptomyces phaeochromogenes]
MPEHPVRIAVFYARADERHREKFRTSIADMVRHGIEYFDDRGIAPGQPWKEKLFKNLESADVIVLLLTPEFIASRFCMEEEVPHALRRHAAGACEILPVKVASFCLADESPLCEIQWFPSDKPVTERGNATAKAWVEVAKELQRVIKRVRSEERDRDSRLPPNGAQVARGVKYGPPSAAQTDSGDSPLARLERVTQGISFAVFVIGALIALIFFLAHSADREKRDPNDWLYDSAGVDAPPSIEKLVRKSNSASPSASRSPEPDKSPLDAQRFTLQESNNPFTADKDKLDIDTGDPGHGTQPQIRSNPGRLADLILEPERLHTPDNEPRILLVESESAINPTLCATLLEKEQNNLRGSVPLDELPPGSHLCVKTDEGLSAVMEVTEISSEYPVSLTLEVTTAQGAST